MPSIKYEKNSYDFYCKNNLFYDSYRLKIDGFRCKHVNMLKIWY